MTDDQFNDLVNTVQQLTEKTDSLADSIATVDTKVEKVKYLSRLFDVNVTYPAENDVLVYDKTGKWKNIQYDEVGFEPGEGGESDIYLIGTDDPTSPTNENTYSAARINEDRLNKISESGDSMNGNLTMVEGTKIIVNGIQSHNAQQSTDSGSGLIYNVDSSGNSYVEVDSLCVRKAALFNQLEIKKITSVGGSLIVSLASNTIIRVETVSALYDGQYQNVYRCYYRNSDDQSKESIVTDFQAGDLAKIQSFNISDTGIYEEPVENRFYWGKVLGIGSNSIGGYIDLSQTDVDSSTNTQPKAGDSLVMYGNKDNISRQNVIDITTYANNAPAIILYQGIDDYSTTDKAIIEMAYDSAEDQSQAYMNVYGRMYVGTKDKTTSYMKFDPTENGGTGQLTVKAKIVVEGQDGDETLIEGGYIKTDLINVNNLLADAIWTGEIKVGGTAEDPNFYVDSNGNITAKHATLTGGTISGDLTFSGKLQGPTGTLGGFTINSNSIKSSNLTISPTGITYNNSGNSVSIFSSENASGINIGTDSISPGFYCYNSTGLSASFPTGIELRTILAFDTLVPAVSNGTSGNFVLDTTQQFHGLSTVYLFNQSGVDYVLPQIQYFVNRLGLEQSPQGIVNVSFFMIFGTNYSSSLLNPGNGPAYDVIGGAGTGLNDRPIFVHSQDTGATQTSITLDNFSLVLYLAELYYNGTWRMIIRQIAGSR